MSVYLKDKFPDRVISQSNTISELLNDIYNYGYTSINQLNNDIDIAFDAFLKYENKHPPHSEEGRKFHDVGIVRGIMKIIKSSETPHSNFTKFIKKNLALNKINNFSKHP